jgi:ABC-type transport system involved in multi-copper enzyme maturation permease subunit
VSILPVIARELRSQARQPFTYWLRIVGGISVACAVAFAIWAMNRELSQWQEISRISNRGWGRFGAPPFSLPSPPNPSRSFGTALFGKMNLFIFVAIWTFVPLASADAVSRERREGTLPLLYLTELRSRGIVIGKAFVHFLRSLSLFLTMAPWLMLPLVFGSLGVAEVRMALLINFASVLLAQAAGLLASTFPRDWVKSAILAEVFALPLLLLMLNVHGSILSTAVALGTPPALKPGTPAFWNSSFAGLSEVYEIRNSNEGLLSRTARLIGYATNGSTRQRNFWFSPNGYQASAENVLWQEIWTTVAPVGRKFWFFGTVGMVVGSAFVLWLAALLGAWRVERSWRDAPPPLWLSELKQRFFSPRFAVSFLRQRLSQSLTGNPIGWLQHYSPASRSVKWGWCLFIIMVEIVLSDNVEDLYTAQRWLGLFLLLGLTFSATGSFRHELENGAFELWLVTPLRERQIIMGRVRGLWRQFLPSLALFGAGSIYLSTGWGGNEYSGEAWATLLRTIAGFCTLPLIGLYFSIRRWNFFTAWLAACLIGFLPVTIGHLFGMDDAQLIVMQVMIALTAGALLAVRLRHRKFQYRRI